MYYAEKRPTKEDVAQVVKGVLSGTGLDRVPDRIENIEGVLRQELGKSKLTSQRVGLMLRLLYPIHSFINTSSGISLL